MHVFRQVLGHALGQRGDEDAITFQRHFLALGHEVVHLGFHRADEDRRVDEAGGADDLLGEDAAGLVQLPLAGRGGDADGLRAHRVPLLEAQRPVVDAGGQAEAIFGERCLAVEVAPEHAADLRDGDVAFVDEDQRIVRQVFEQGGRRFAGLAAREVARIVLDARAGARRHHHLDVEHGALLEALGLQQAARIVELGKPDAQVVLDAAHRLFQRGLGRDVMRVGIDLDLVELRRLLAGERIELRDLLDLVAEQRDAPGAVLEVGGEELDGVAAHAKGAAHEILVVAFVVERHEIGQQLALGRAVAFLQLEGHGGIGFDVADAVDAGDGGHHDHVVALQQRARGRVAHAVDLLVDGGFLLDVGVAAGDVSLRRVVVVVGDEILHRVFGEEALELAIKLRGQRLVGGEDEGRALGGLDHLGDREGLAGAGDAQEHLVTLQRLDAVDQLPDGGGLVALRLELGHRLEGAAAVRFRRLGRFDRRKGRQRHEFRPQGAEALRDRCGGVEIERLLGFRESAFLA